MTLRVEISNTVIFGERTMKKCITAVAALIAVALIADFLLAQPPEGRGERDDRPDARRGGPPGERGGPGGPGGRGGDFRRPEFPLMVALDTDKDGEISADEIKNASKLLNTLDKNEDGKLSPDELRPTFPGRGRGGPGGPEGGRPTSPEAMVERIMGMDKDGDGKVTKDEVPEQMQRMFERGDADGDGAISKAEAGKIAERMGGRGGPGGGRGRGPQGEEGRRERPQRPAEE